MKWKWKILLIKIAIGFILAASLISATAYTVNKHNTNEQVKIIEKHEEDNKSYIISKETVMSKLKTKSQIVSMEQEINKKDVEVDDGFTGERHTELKMHGTYKVGLNTKDIEIDYIEQNTGTVYIELGKPVLISLDIPYDEIEFKKTHGFFRMAASEGEQKNFYKASKKNIEIELMKNNEVLKTANAKNKEVIKDILMQIDGINYIVFK
ncbi:DUF4230 domain-containing protein [Priestia aryabhattai]|uniref:DUF4230 domain-containing protein n=1 Tax=Priestia aryabhattai TaxID=412384 RepID=UPI003531F622